MIMNWINIKRTDYVELECTNPIIGIYVVRFSPTTITTPDNNEQSEEDIRVLPVRFTKNPTVYDVQQEAIMLQEEYDKSNEVNTFIYNNERYWFNKQERVTLLNSFNIIKESGETSVNLWLNGIKVVFNVNTAINFIQNLELYAVACNNITEEHINQISSLNTIEGVAAFDITADYPNQLELIV